MIDDFGNKIWIKFGRSNLILGFFLYFISISIPSSVNVWIFHFVYCLLSGYFICSIFFVTKKSGLYFYLSDPKFALILSYFIFYIAGSSILIFGSDIDIFNRMEEYEIDSNLACYVDSINAAGLGFTILTSVFIKPKFMANQVKNLCNRSKLLDVKKIFISLFTIGAIFTIYVVYFDIKHEENQVLSGSIRQLKSFLLVAIFIGVVDPKEKNSKFYLILAIISTVISSFMGLLTFSKTDFIMPIVVFVMAYSIRINSIKFALISLLISFVTLSMIGGSILYSRNNYSIIDTNKFSLDDRVKLIYDGSNSESIERDFNKYSTWGRFTLINAQGAAVELYNQGSGGNDFSRILWVFVPRFLYPNKPNLSDTGSQFYTKLTGNEGSSTAQGVFINAYYNIGLIGVPIYSFICGWIIAQLSMVNKIIVFNRSKPLYLIMILSTLIVSNVAGILHTDYIGAFVILISITIFYSFIIKFNIFK